MTITGHDTHQGPEFLHQAFHADDWIAVLLKSAHSGAAVQRVARVGAFTDVHYQRWLQRQNRNAWHVFVSINAVIPGSHSRARNAIVTVRHVFLDADEDGERIEAKLRTHAGLPAPSFMLRSSPARRQVLWRVSDFTPGQAQALQRHLALALGTDRVATSCAQMMRLPGLLNHKYRPAARVELECVNADRVYTPAEFPAPSARPSTQAPTGPLPHVASRDAAARARAYLAAVPPAVAGQHGDVHTFRVCCRVVRGFALADDTAIAVLSEWNARCTPPWSTYTLLAKIHGARRYGREPIGGRLGAHP